MTERMQPERTGPTDEVGDEGGTPGDVEIDRESNRQRQRGHVDRRHEEDAHRRTASRRNGRGPAQSRSPTCDGRGHRREAGRYLAMPALRIAQRRASRRARRPGKSRHGRVRPMWSLVAAAADRDASTGQLTLDVLLWILVELRLADRRAEVIRLALVFALARGLVLVDLSSCTPDRWPCRISSYRADAAAAAARWRSPTPS